MTDPTGPSGELRDLCEAVIEAALTPEQRERLEALVLRDPAARRFYVEYLHQHACLHWRTGLGTGRPAEEIPPVRPTERRPRFDIGRLAIVGGAAALLLVAILGLRLSPTGDRGGAFATLAETKACKWDGGTLPTEAGARLTAGRLRLAEGLARITFDHGADVILEGPADFEIRSFRHCVLSGGRLVARVEPPAIGFTVDTPSAVLTDLGTEFGVHVHPAGTADVQVFKGQVDARHAGSGRTEHMKTGTSLRFGADAVAGFDPSLERPSLVPSPLPAAAAGHRVVRLTTTTGRGKDAYVQPIVPSTNSSTILSLVKNTAQKHSDWDRKAYMAFDLAPLGGDRVAEAQLTLTFTPTGMGFAAEVPDATFVVYGLTDKSLDAWDEATIRWQTAPANRPGGSAVDPEKVVRLGSFLIPQGTAGGAFGISGQPLADFLNTAPRSLATFIVVRETRGSGRNDLVHGFATRRHPLLAPPTLKLVAATR